MKSLHLRFSHPDCQGCRYMQIWVEHFKYQMKSLPSSFLSSGLLTLSTTTHLVLMLYYWRQTAKKGHMLTLSIQTRYKQHAFMSIRTTMQILIQSLWITVKFDLNILNTRWKAFHLRFSHLDCWHCRHNSSGTDVVLLKTESKERAYVDTVDTNKIQTTCLHVHSNYNADSNTKSSNYSKIRFKPLIYFELHQSSN